MGFVLELGETYQAYRDQHPEESFAHTYTFNSARKSMTTVIKKEKGGYLLFSKGASEMILSKCTSIIGSNGETIPFSKDDVEHVIKDAIEPMASCGLRTICLAYKDLTLDKGKLCFNM